MQVEEKLRPAEIDVYHGCMFSRKTDFLLHDLRVASEIGKIHVQLFKPDIGDRGDGLFKVKSRDGTEFPATPIPVNNPAEIFRFLEKETRLVGIDEAQFFDEEIILVVAELARRGVRVIIAELEKDFRNLPFKSGPGLRAIADRAVEFTAICDYKKTSDSPECGERATRTQRFRLDGSPAWFDDPVVVVGGKEPEGEKLYAARCARHHIVPGRPTYS